MFAQTEKLEVLLHMGAAQQLSCTGTQFHLVKTHAAFWSWLEGSFLPNIHAHFRPGSQDPLQLVAGYQLRQVRSRPQPCGGSVFKHVGQLQASHCSVHVKRL